MRGWREGLSVVMVAVALAAPGLAQVKGAPPMAGGPMMGGMGGDKPSAKTAALQKKADQLEAQYKKKPNAKLKMQLAQAKYEYGHARMYDSALSPRQKYRPALKAFREALKLNPNHKQAKEDKDAIEKVYKQMGMPIPQ
jgi:tetratricopeptide (TPR) repeat protein